jgi:glutamyl-tRNA synthetase
MNGQYIATLPAEELDRSVRSRLEAAGFREAPLLDQPAAFQRLLELLRPRAKRLADFVEQATPFLGDTVEYEPAALAKYISSADIADHRAELSSALRTTTPFDQTHVEATVRGTAERQSLKAGALIHATRVALTGRTVSPGLFELITLLGRDETVLRIQRLAAFVRTRNPQVY